jgi:nucleotide-binding universal stress UspA family protein
MTITISAATSGHPDVDAGIGAGQRHDRIVVGVDGSAPAGHALRWAIEEARLRQARCQVIEAWSPTIDMPEISAGQRVLSALVDDALGEFEGTPPADVDVRRGNPVDILARAAEQADLLVVGSRGRGAFKSHLLGSVSAALVQRGTGPTVVVPPDAANGVRHSRVVVGVDGSDQGIRAVEWARAEAALRHAELLVIHAWHLPVAAGSVYTPTAVVPFEECAEAAQAILDRAVSHGPAGADVVVVAQLIEGRAEHELVKAAAHADLLVVGSRGHSALAAAVLGSTSRSCVHHAPCPVAIIP